MNKKAAASTPAMTPTTVDTSEWLNWERPLLPYEVVFSNPDGDTVRHIFGGEPEASKFAAEIAADKRCTCLSFFFHTVTRK